MYMLILLFALAYGQMEETINVNTEDCDDGGYLDGLSNGGDCCSFFVCDGATNKTAYKGSCMGGTAWNNDLKVCDEPKYVPGCDVSLCVVPKRTTEECDINNLGSDECCVAGRKPVYTMKSTTEYRREGDIKNNVCPPGEIFNLTDCCCEPAEARVAPCGDPKENYHSNGGECCSYLQCWANGTGTDIVQCMPPSVWNDVIKSCDMPFNVMGCMDTVCGADTTNYACNSGDGNCCRDGIWYSSLGGNQYVISSVEREEERDWENDPLRALCCEDDMDGKAQVFNDLPDICCCEPEGGDPDNK